MARSRTTKTAAKRIELDYAKRANALLRWRRVLIGVAALLCVAWIAFAASPRRPSRASARLGQAAHNPGPLVRAHAYIEQDCAQCHDKQAGGWSRSVSDAACQRCHDAAGHHPNKILRLSREDKASPAIAVVECASCHVEHRGRQALLATSDEICLTCHRNLKAAAIGSTQVAPVVTAFAVGTHPPFGRSVVKKDKDGNAEEPTHLKFSHASHLTGQDRVAIESPKRINDVCIRCHATAALSTTVAPTRTLDRKKSLPPYELPTDPSSGELLPLEQSMYMRPISYLRHCRDCHDRHLVLPDLGIAGLSPSVASTKPFSLGWQIPHASPEVLRPLIDAVVEAQVDANGIKFVAQGDAVDVLTGEPTLGPITKQQWESKVLEAIRGTVQSSLPTTRESPANEPTTTPSAGGQAVKLRGFLLAFTLASEKACLKCHRIKSASPITNDGRAPVVHLFPTGITNQPKVWYPHSRFDHDAHRQLSCLDCHKGADKSSHTPDLALLPKIDSCVDCHRSNFVGDGGSLGNCVTCHRFHDRLTNRPMVSSAAISAK